MNGVAWAPSRVPAFALLGNPQLQQQTAGLLPPGSLSWAGAAARGSGWQPGLGLPAEHLQQQQHHGAVWPGPYQPSGERVPATSCAGCQAAFCTRWLFGGRWSTRGPLGLLDPLCMGRFSLSNGRLPHTAMGVPGRC